MICHIPSLDRSSTSPKPIPLLEPVTIIVLFALFILSCNKVIKLFLIGCFSVIGL